MAFLTGLPVQGFDCAVNPADRVFPHHSRAGVRHRNIECITVQGAAIDDFIAIFREMYDWQRCQAVVQVIDFQISKVADEKVMVFHSHHLRFRQSAVRCGCEAA